MTARRITVAGLGLVLGWACRVDYHCDRDEQCVTDDQPGTCEPQGWCSYADASCDSGRRWGPQAGEHADECARREDDGDSSG